MPSPPPTSYALHFDPVSLPENHEQLRAEVCAFLAEERAAGRFIAPRRSYRFSKEFSKSMGRRGWIGLTWPKKYGGHERSALERYVIIEELLAAGAPIGAHWVADRQTGPLLLRYGSEKQRERFLPQIVRGGCYFCIGMSEPDSGSDLASIRTSAQRVEGGWRLNGTKLWTSWAHQAHYMLALVRTEARGEDLHAGLSQMIIDLRSPGLSIRPVYNLAGDHDFNEEVFSDCFVPDEMVVGEVGNGWEQVMSELAFERSGPERFLLSFQVFVELVRVLGPQPSKHACEALGRLAGHLMTLRNMSLSIAGMLERGAVPNVESALVKDLGTNLAKQVSEIARQLAQSEGVDGDEQFSDVLLESILYSPIHTIQGGTREILRGIIARELGLR